MFVNILKFWFQEKLQDVTKKIEPAMEPLVVLHNFFFFICSICFYVVFLHFYKLNPSVSSCFRNILYILLTFI